ncbi:MAG TPA: hypothetical protein VJ063_02425 [Verrucomicrobiae bacterium]|nr:hypothetical protein [Verrucomicrobiae bacterium]
MAPNDEAISRLHGNFEGRQAIYVEKGALLVRVSEIRRTRTMVAAQIEEIQAPGLGVGSFADCRSNRKKALRWTIRAGDVSEFTEQCWQMGYGGWSLYFEPRLVQDIMQLAAQFQESLDAFERYKRILAVLQRDQGSCQGKWQPLFPAA